MIPENPQDIVNESLSARMSRLESDKRKLEVEKMVLIEKGLSSDNPNDIIKAMQESEKFYEDFRSSNKNQKSIIADPFYYDNSLGFKEKASRTPDSILRKMADYPLVKSVIQTRVEQLVKFSEPQADKYSTGFEIRKRTRPWDQKEESLSSEEKKVIAYLTDFMLFCGTNENKWHGDTFDSFLRKITTDSLTMDKLTFEVIRNRKGLPAEFVATDSATMFFTSTEKDRDNHNKKKINGQYPTACQVYDNQIIADFYPWELCFAVRNPQSDLRYNGYGRAELEDLISTVTSMVWADEYNSRFFSQGSVPKGIMKVSQNVSTTKLNEFRQEWMAMMQGVYNSHKTPILEADKFEWVDLHKSNNDMEFSKWQEYLIKVLCAVFKMDPSEVGFPTENGVDQSSMFQANNEYKLKYSADKGLKPLLKFIQYQINKFIIWEINPEYEFAFVGFDSETQAQEEERLIKAAGVYMEINEVRKIKNLEPKPEYDIIANPVILQSKQMAMYGDPNSNQAVETEEKQKQIKDSEKTQKGLDSNPIWGDVQKFIEEELTE